MAQCEKHKQNGQPCRARAMRGVTFCFSHNPAAKKTKREASQRGGRNRRIPKRAARPKYIVRVESISDVQQLLFRTLTELRNGDLDAELARTVGYLSGVATKVAEAADLEQRMREIEQKVTKFVDRLGG